MVRPRVAWFVSVLVCLLVAGVSLVSSAQPTTYGGITFPLGDVSFADRVVAYVEGSCVRCAYSHPTGVIGPPDCGGSGCQACSSCDPCALSLGYRLSTIDGRGYVTAEFLDNRLIDGPGNDLFIYITNDKAAQVDISVDGVTWISVGQTKGYPGAIDIGPYVQAGQEYRLVRVWDVPNDEDKSSCPGPSIDAIGAMGRALVIQYTLSVTIVGSGSVSKSPDLATYARGTTVTVQAVPQSGWTFVGWSGDASGTTNPTSIFMDSDKSITATFATAGAAEGTLALVPAGSLAANVSGVASNLLIIQDVSSSMGDPFEGSTKIAIAKAALNQLVDQIPDGYDVGLRVFSGCDENSTLLIPIGPLDRAALKRQIALMQPGGATAIQYVLEQAKLDFANIAGAKKIVFVSDGSETCGGDPVAAARALIAAGLDLHIDVIGFDVGGDSVARAQLRAIADATGGIYLAANSGEDLRTALQLTMPGPLTYHVYNAQGTEVHTGIVGETSPTLPEGTYRVVIDTTPPIDLPAVTVEAGETTQVTVTRTDGGYSTNVTKG